MRKVLFQIAPLDCPGCGKKIEDRLSDQNGVISVKVFSKLGKIRVEFDEAKTNLEQLEAIISDFGYVVESKRTA